MKILYWNVNGIRAISAKNVYMHQSFEHFLVEQDCDILIFGETKICSSMRKTNNKVQSLFGSYRYQYHAHSCKRKGYSGVSVYSKIEPKKIIAIDNEEGRYVILEYERFILIGLYVPNSGSALARLDYRTRTWDKWLRAKCKQLSNKKEIVIAGDMNVARDDIDISHPERHHRTAGFTDEERSNYELLFNECDLVDLWRDRHPSTIAYTYFDYRTKARLRNFGWRLDYILSSQSMKKHLRGIHIYDNVYGSDHLPIMADFFDFSKK